VWVAGLRVEEGGFALGRRGGGGGAWGWM